MKICVECGRQLFDFDKLCDMCNSKNIISEKEYNDIVEEIKHANIFTKKNFYKTIIINVYIVDYNNQK